MEGLVSGAIVEAVTACPDDHINLVQETTTAANGEFDIPPFYENCKRIRLSARRGLWLKTGQDVFYGKQIGTAPNLLGDVGERLFAAHRN